MTIAARIEQAKAAITAYWTAQEAPRNLAAAKRAAEEDLVLIEKQRAELARLEAEVNREKFFASIASDVRELVELDRELRAAVTRILAKWRAHNEAASRALALAERLGVSIKARSLTLDAVMRTTGVAIQDALEPSDDRNAYRWLEPLYDPFRPRNSG